MSDETRLYLLFGIRADDLDTARCLIEVALDVRMTPHESSYRGGDYFRLGAVDSEELILQSNYDSTEEEWAEPSFPQLSFLLYVDRTDRGSEITARLASVAELLTRQES